MKTLLSIGLLATLAPFGAGRGDDMPPSAKRTDQPEPVNVKGQIHARYVAAGQEDERKGLWGPSNNYPKALAREENFGEPEQLSVVVSPEEAARIGGAAAVRLRIVNRSDERVVFSAIDSHLFIVQEAKNETGEWRPIERIPHGTGPRDCAVGFHRISLKPGQFWELAGPRYAGPFKTKLRFRVDLGKNDGPFPTPGGKLVYSNEFDGSIHREQFEKGGPSFFDLNAPSTPAKGPTGN